MQEGVRLRRDMKLDQGSELDHLKRLRRTCFC